MSHRSHLLAALFLPSFAAIGVAQESAAVLDAPVVVLPGDNRIEHLVDFDGDGWMDLLAWWPPAANSDQMRIRAWRNLAGAGFSVAWATTFTVTTGLGGSAKLAVGDVNGDGAVDFAVEYRQQVRIYAGEGLAEPQLLQTLTAPGMVDQILFADLGGDGLADLLLFQFDDKLMVHVNSGAAGGWAQTLASTVDLPAPRSRLRVGELSGDGVDDVLYVLPQEIQILRLESDGTVAGTQQFATSATWVAPRPAIGDLDGDGDDDVVVWDGDAPSGFNQILRREGAGAFTLEPVRAGGPATELADIDLDGDLDGICCGSGGGGSFTWLNAGSSIFNICHNLGGGVFSPSFQMHGVGSTHIAGAADIDHDGDVDLIAGRVIYYAPGLITESPVLRLPAPLATPAALVDFDDDGDHDFNLSPGVVQRSNGQFELASFAPRIPAPPAGSTYHGPGYTGDFDGDGDLDWIVARASGGAFVQMELLTNAGEGTFVPGGPAAPSGVSFGLDAPLAHSARSYFTADVDGDGDLDLITRSIQSAPVPPWKSRIWLNDGDGSFSAGQLLNAHSVMAVGQLTADPHVDLVVVAGTLNPQLGVWRGLGNGSFVSHSGFFATGFESDGPDETIALLDADGDGDVDVLACDQDPNAPGALFLWRNDGNGNFSFASPGEWLNTTRFNELIPQVIAGDVNGDGWDDVITWPAAEAYSAAWILLRASNGVGFQPALLQAVQPLALADLDSDGDADVISRAPSGLDNLRVLSRAIEGPAVGSRRQYGEGVAAPAGCVPLLGAVGPFRVGEFMRLHMRGGVGGATGYLAVSLLESATPDTPFPGLTSYVGLPQRKLPIRLDGPLGAPCVGEKTRQFRIPAGFAGQTVYYQLVLNDASAPHGVVCSNGLELSYD